MNNLEWTEITDDPATWPPKNKWVVVREYVDNPATYLAFRERHDRYSWHSIFSTLINKDSISPTHWREI